MDRKAKTGKPAEMLSVQVQLPAIVCCFPLRLPGRRPVSAGGIQYMNAGVGFAVLPAFRFRQEYITFREAKQEWTPDFWECIIGDFVIRW